MAAPTQARLLCSLSLGWPLAAIAEVSDKMDSEAMLPIVVAVGLLTLVICWRWSKAALALFPALCVVSGVVMFDDDPVLAAYRQEIGDEAFNAYQVRSVLTLSLMPLGALVGSALAVARARSKRRRS